MKVGTSKGFVMRSSPGLLVDCFADAEVEREGFDDLPAEAYIRSSAYAVRGWKREGI